MTEQCPDLTPEDVEKMLRYEWWVHHGCDFIALYGDDGEMSCGSCFTDFKRMPLNELNERVVKLRMAYAARQVDGTRTKPGTLAPDQEFVSPFTLSCRGCDATIPPYTTHQCPPRASVWRRLLYGARTVWPSLVCTFVFGVVYVLTANVAAAFCPVKP